MKTLTAIRQGRTFGFLPAFTLSALLKAAFTVLAFSMMSCHLLGEEVHPDPDPIVGGPGGGGGCFPPNGPGQCIPDTYVTVTNVGCGVGVWGSNWLRLDNGDYLQPWLSNNTAPVTPGERYKIAYAPVVRDNLYDTVITCMAMVPDSEPVRINCMELDITP